MKNYVVLLLISPPF